MDHSHRSGSIDSASASTSSTNSMPNVLFREIHKNAFLKRHSSDRRTGFPRKSERVWVVFCVHDDVEPFLEIYPDQKVALTHKPEWFASLSSALHVSPTICGHEDEFEFAVTLSFQVVRLAAPSWESMMEWVETIRSKLRELKVLCPKENVYSKMPEQKQTLLPTRDPNSPLPLPPEGPSTLLPGVELVHLQPRNGPSVSDNGESGRSQRDLPRSNVMPDRQVNKRPISERDKRTVTEQQQQQLPVVPGSSQVTHSEIQNSNSAAVPQLPVNPGDVLPKNKQRIRKMAPIPQPFPSTSQVISDRNITVIEVPASGSKENHTMSEFPALGTHNSSDSDGTDDVFQSPSGHHKLEVTNSGTNNNNHAEEEEEAHYEHVFLQSIPINKPRQPMDLPSKCPNVASIKIGKPHSTSVMINTNNSVPVSGSGNVTGGSSSTPGVSALGLDVKLNGSTCINLTKNSVPDPVVPHQIQTKPEKIIVSGIDSRAVNRAKKPGNSKPNGNDSNVNTSNSIVIPEISSIAGPNGAIYSHVIKVPKVKVKSDELKSRVSGRSGISLHPRSQVSEMESVGESSSILENPSEVRENHLGNIKSPNRIVLPQKSIINKNMNPIRRETQRNLESNQPSSSVSNMENKIDVATTTAMMASDISEPNASKNESRSNGSNNPEIEPIPATVQPTVGVISVEDIPLIGGHQRRRRRSSSTDATAAPNAPPSRVIGGADRIRINIPQTGGILTRDDHRGESEGGTVSDQIVHINPTPKSSRLTLREQQVLQLKKEMLHPGGVRLQLRRKDCTGSIALVDVLNGVWVAGWKQKEHPLLYNALHIGDQLISVCDMVVRTSADAHKLIRSSTSLYIEFIIRRVPFGNVFALQRSSEGQNLGIVQEGNTAEIKEVVPNSVAARQGLTSKTPTCDGLSLTTWFLTEINGRPLNLFFKDSEVRDRLNAVGKEISILVQPHDFIKQIKKQLKNMRGYKDYIVQ
ncbi:hypothetical protein RUM44_001047 [Polyplax serrata]|uniref:PH domain-containing protein n=1 Tax=Polyplax serrata TaxID=468196 RepID=A0ABR1B6K8_POLSC